MRILISICACVVLVFQVGCQCNNSKLHSGSSDKMISHVLEKDFSTPMDRDNRLITAFGLVDSGLHGLGVHEAQTNKDILVQLGPSGCQFFYPVSPRTNLLIQFSNEGIYEGYERWLMSDEPRSPQLSEHDGASDETKEIPVVRRGYISNYHGAPREYKRVERKDFFEARK